MFHFWIGWNPNQTHKKYTKFCSCFQLFWKKDKKKNIKNRTTHQKKNVFFGKKIIAILTSALYDVVIVIICYHQLSYIYQKLCDNDEIYRWIWTQ